MTVLCARPPVADEVVAIDGARRIPADDWDRLARRGFHLHGWCSAAERCGWQGRHVVVSGAEGLRAIVPSYLVAGGVAHDLHDRWLGPLRGPAARTGLGLRPVLSVQAPFAQCSEPMTGGEALPAVTLDRVFAALEAAGERAGARAVVWPFVDAARGDLIAAARERGYAVVYAGASAWLPVRWATFEEYLGSRSKSVRRTVRADLRALAAACVRTEAVSDFGGAAGDMDRLYRDAFLRRNGRPAPTPDDLFARLAAAVPPVPERVAQLAWQGDRLVGMSVNLRGAEVLDGALAAFAADHAGGPVYYHDLCYQPLRLAFAHGIGAIDLGASALYAKVLRGAVLRRRVALVRGRSRVAHKALAALGAVVARRVEAKERRALGALWHPAIAAGEER